MYTQTTAPLPSSTAAALVVTDNSSITSAAARHVGGLVITHMCGHAIGRVSEALDMCADMPFGMCIYGHVCRHVYGHVYEYVVGRVPRRVS